MFKRIHSKRDPSDTIWTELVKQFGSQLEKAGTRFGSFCAHYPRAIYSIMLGLLVISGTLSFTVFRHPVSRSAAHAAAQQKQPPGGVTPAVVGDSFSRLAGTAAALKQTLSLKQQADALLARGHLSHADSLALGRMLDTLQQLQHQTPH